VLSDLARLKAVRLTVNGRTFVARTQLEGDVHLAFRAVLVMFLAVLFQKAQKGPGFGRGEVVLCLEDTHQKGRRVLFGKICTDAKGIL